MHQDPLEKLKALLSRTLEAGCTGAEAAAAMEAAQRIAARHNIDLASVRVDDGAAIVLETDRATLQAAACGTRRPYHEAIARVIIVCFGVRLVVWQFFDRCHRWREDGRRHRPVLLGLARRRAATPVFTIPYVLAGWRTARCNARPIVLLWVARWHHRHQPQGARGCFGPRRQSLRFGFGR